MKHNFLLGLTTTSGSNWREKIKEVKRFNISEVALFPTPMEIEERKELYKLIDDSPIVSIPHVHMRHDFQVWELDYLSENYGTKLFNLHATESCKVGFESYPKKYQEMIYFENHTDISELFRELIDVSAGVCVDFGHWKDNYEYRGFDNYKDFPALLSTHKIGCCHISAMRKEGIYDPSDGVTYHVWHTAEGAHELEYMKEFTHYLPEYCSIELENSFEEQLVFKKYLEGLVEGKA